MKRINAQGRVREYVYVAMFLLLFVVVLMFLRAMPQAATAAISGERGFCDLSQSDFEGTVYKITKSAWESWPEKLYAPQDLADAEPPVQLESPDYQIIQYATHRLRLTLPNAGIYGIMLTSSDYSMRLYIDGKEVGSVGVPATTREKTEPRTLSRVYYFFSESGEAELVIQAANFVHSSSGAWPPQFHIGSGDNITRRNTVNTALGFIITAYLLTAFFDHLGLFCLNRKRKSTLVFALSCLLLALMDKNLLFMLFPNYDWFVAIRFEYIVHFGTFAMLTLFFDMLYPKLLNKYVARAYLGLAAVYILLTVFTDPLVFTGLIAYFDYISIAMIAYVFVRLAMSLKSGGMGNLLSFLGCLVLGVAGVNDILFYQGLLSAYRFAGEFFTTPVAMTFFVFCNSMVVSVEYVDTELSLIDERRQSERLSADNAVLENINLMRTDLMTTVSHETRTPLAVISSYTELISMELRAQGVSEQHAKDLDTVSDEIQHIGRLIEEMQSLSRARSEDAGKSEISLADVISQTARLYGHILERRKTRLSVKLPDALPSVYANPGEVTQVLLNLLQNAGKHTEGGEVVIKASIVCNGKQIEVSVTDTGAGIPPELLPRVFERGVSGEENGTGIGLVVCREIIKAHDGEIWIESEQGKGAIVKFTLPVNTEV